VRKLRTRTVGSHLLPEQHKNSLVFASSRLQCIPRTRQMMKYFKMAKWTAALGCLCFEGLMSQASALSLRPDQVSELDVGRAGRSEQAQQGDDFKFKPWTDFVSKHNRGPSGTIAVGDGNDLLGSDGDTTRVAWFHLTAAKGEHKDKDDQGQPHPPFPDDVLKDGSKPFQVPDLGSTLVLLGLGLSLSGLFQQKPGRSLG
jgi:hypothetical protein